MTQGLLTTEIDRLTGCFDRLMPHVQPGSLAVTGGVGIQLGMAALGRQGPRDDIADLDLVAASVGAISPTVAGSFLVLPLPRGAAGCSEIHDSACRSHVAHPGGHISRHGRLTRGCQTDCDWRSTRSVVLPLATNLRAQSADALAGFAVRSD